MKAFVIMPYGGTDPELIREYKRVFRYLIQDAIDNYDSKAEIIRQDYSGEGGYIIRNVIDNLATADLVVADISTSNWNVAYELGLRHAMSKYGTVLICNDKTPLPYDIKQMNIIIYPAEDWIDNAEEISDQITKAIDNAMKKSRSDSPVFDVYPGLPDSLPLALSDNNDKDKARIVLLNEELGKAKAEIDQLRTRIESAGLDSSEVKQSKNLREIMQRAVAKRVYTSDEAVSLLRKYADENNYDEFAEFLAKVLQEGYLTELDCKKLYTICKRLNIPDITKAFLEAVVEFYPDSEELRAWLANAYSTDYHDRDKAISIVNEAVGVRRKDGHYELVSKVRTQRLLGAMFDVYLHLKKYTDIITIGNLLLEKSNTKHRGIIYRNIGYAAVYLEDFDTARSAYENAVKEQPDNAISYYLGFKYFDAIGDRAKTFESLENCMRLAPDDPDYCFMLAAEVCDELHARIPETMEIAHIEPADKEKYAAPYVLHAFFRDPKSLLERTVDFLKRNKFNSTLEHLSNLLNDKESKESFLSAYDFSMVHYCFRAV